MNRYYQLVIYALCFWAGINLLFCCDTESEVIETGMIFIVCFITTLTAYYIHKYESKQ